MIPTPFVANILNLLGIGWIFYHGMNGVNALTWANPNMWIGFAFIWASVVPTTYYWFGILNGVGRQIIISKRITPDRSADELLVKPFIFLRLTATSIDTWLTALKSGDVFQEHVLLRDGVMEVINKRIAVLALGFAIPYFADKKGFKEFWDNFSTWPAFEAFWIVFMFEVSASMIVMVCSWLLIRTQIRFER